MLSTEDDHDRWKFVKSFDGLYVKNKILMLGHLLFPLCELFINARIWIALRPSFPPLPISELIL